MNRQNSTRINAPQYAEERSILLAGPHGRDDHELVAAVSAEKIRSSHTRFQEVCTFTQYAVTVKVTIGVVDILEVVDIDDDKRKFFFEPFSLSDVSDNGLIKKIPVVQSGQQVSCRELCAVSPVRSSDS